MKILITGNMGYVGPVLVAHLRNCWPDSELVGLDLGFFSHCLTNAKILPESRLDLQHFADVRAVDDRVLSSVDAIVHLAALSNDPMGNRYEKATLEINHQASVRLARQAKALGVSKFIFASSCSVYGFAEEGARNEDAPVNPLTAYAKSKVFTERDLAPLASNNFRITCLRFATACGMSERLRLDLVLNDFVASAIATGKITVLSDGSPWRPLIHVRDMARAIEWAIGRTGDNFLVFNAGSEEWNYQVRDLAFAVANVFSGVDIFINQSALPDKRSYKVDFARFRNLAPRHQPQVGLIEAIQGLKEGLEGMRFHDADFRSSSLMRLKELSKLCETGLLSDDLSWADCKKPSAVLAAPVAQTGPYL
jgi:nucleoside-diphosphate-sugar epimerase